MPVRGSYWILPLTSTSFAFSTEFFYFIYQNLFLAINVQGNTISLPTGASSYAAIDTGTTLVGGPPKYIADIFAQIPGSSPGTDLFQKYYTYRAFSFFYIIFSFSSSHPTHPKYLLMPFPRVFSL
jgi:cathepsin D